MKELKVTVIKTNVEHVHEALGISDERNHEISELTKKLLFDKKGVGDNLASISEHVDNANEFALAIFNYASNLGRVSSMSGLLCGLLK